MPLLITAFTLWQTLTAGVTQVRQPPLPVSCGADAREPNDLRARARSARVSPIEARTCADDPDWFYFEVAAGERVEARVEHAANAYLQLEVYAPRKRTPIGPATRNARRTAVRVEPSKAGTYRVRVQSDTPVSTPYTLRIVRAGRAPRAAPGRARLAR